MTETIDLTEPEPRRRRWPLFGAWTAAALMYAVALHKQIELPFLYSFMTAAVHYYSLALLMIPVAQWSSRLHARRLSAVAMILRHVVAGLAVMIVWQTLNAVYMRVAVGPQFWELTYAKTWMFQLLTAVTTYGTALGLTLAFQASDRERERERRESELMILARDSELAAIKAQMQPHFVLNVLNSVLVLIEKDPATARTMVIRLSELMRAVFEQFEVVQIPLRREIDLTKAYLEIERIRFGPRLSIVFDIDRDAADAIVPAFLLQPIVENAIKHGIGLQSGPGTLKISARIRARRLEVAVTNSTKIGTAPDLDASSHSGMGLQLTRRRLMATYGHNHRLTFASEPASLTVKFDLPANTHDHETLETASRR